MFIQIDFVPADAQAGQDGASRLQVFAAQGEASWSRICLEQVTFIIYVFSGGYGCELIHKYEIINKIIL